MNDRVDRQKMEARFTVMRRDVEAETDRDGGVAIESVLAEMDAIIAAHER
jgi:hypothetical protein